MTKCLHLLLGITLASAGHAADLYVRDGGSCSSSCTNWNTASAYDELSSAVSAASRGDTIWVADGTYSSATLGVAESGSATISIIKATVASHGTSTGWVDAYGDGQATIAGLTVNSGYWTVDGISRTSSDWTDGSAYGFRITGRIYSSSIDPGPDCPNNNTFRYINLGAADIGNSRTGSEPDGFYLGGFGEACESWTIEYNYIHNVELGVLLNDATNTIIQYNWFQHAWSKEIIRGQAATSGTIIRWNVMKDTCQDAGGGGEACTAEIAMWSGTTAGDYDNIEVYGNLIYKTTEEQNTGGSIVIGGDGSSWVGVSASNVLIYNNTIAGIHVGEAGILVNGGSGNVCRNNLWYDSAGAPTASCNTQNNNGESGTDPFLGYAGGDFRLSGAIAGVALSSPYDTDILGATRGLDGTWDRGAYEYTLTGPAKSGGGARHGGGAKIGDE